MTDIDIQVEEGSENVFADIGVREPEESLLRAKLAKQIVGIIERRNLNQTQIADILGIDQPKVSKLIRGQISGFGSERLFRFLSALGCDVKIEVKARRAANRRGKLTVVAA